MEEVRSVAEYIECLKGYQRNGLCGYRPEMTVSAPRAGSYIVRIGERSVRMNAK